jgi:hypothetical protein
MTERLRNGYFLAADGDFFKILNGSMYAVEPDEKVRELLKDKKPGYYDKDFNFLYEELPK